jgi:hypothetical protein
MKKKMIITMLVLLFVVGCTSYHKVTDLNSGKAYYTTEVKYKGSGAVDIKDDKTGARIVLPSSEVLKITKEEYNHGIYSDD